MPAFYYDIICPFAYIAFSRLHRENVFAKKNIELKPILLGGLFKLINQESTESSSRLSKIRADYTRQDIKRQAHLWQISLNFHERHPVSSLNAMRLITSCIDRREELSARLYESYWQHGQDIDDENFLKKLALEFNCQIKSETKNTLRQATSEAFEAGIFGVPTMFINNRLYFGSDRLELIEEELGLTACPKAWPKSDKIINFYFDFSSPYSYLAHAEIQKAEKAGVKINYIPVVLGALFKESGLNDIPILKAHPNKARYHLQDMKDWAHARGSEFNFSPYFPLRSLNALRVALVEPQTISAIFSGAWAQSLDIGDEKILSALLDKAGFSSSTLLAKAQDLEIKNQLKNNTASALELGIFGVPSFIIENNLLFGQDRFLWLKNNI